jgi:hypothetical protein
MAPILAAALVLQLHNFAGAPPAVVTDAASEVTRMYARIGAHVESHAALGTRVGDREIVQVVLLANETGDLRHIADTVMGAAVRTPQGTRVVYVFYRRVREEAERYGVSTALVLACAMAHEVGHLLMPGRGHSTDGLMRALWHADDFQRADQGLLRFSDEQVGLIRRALASEPLVEYEGGHRARE